MALTLEQVQGMLATRKQEHTIELEALTVRINGFLQGEGQPIKDAIDAHHIEIKNQRDVPVNHKQRMNDIVTQFKASSFDTIAEVARQRLVLTEQQAERAKR